MQALTVVVPCAGAGSRLGLPFPKELLPTGAQGEVVLDHLCALLRGTQVPVRVLVVIDESRQATLQHLRRRHGDLPTAAVHQHPQARELPGALACAQPWFSSRVLVLLPDQILHAPPPRPLPDLVAQALEEAPACVAAAREDNPSRIGSDGAIALRGTGGALRVAALADKPGPAASAGFNAVWFALGFRAEAAEAVIGQLTAAQRPNAPAVTAAPLGGAPAIEVPAFTDAGTWPDVRRLWREASACG